MHIYLFVRGKITQVKEWEAHAQAAYWKWRRINQETGKEEVTLVQGALRPSVFGAYEYVFPKEALAEVCSFFGITRNYQYGFDKDGGGGKKTAARHAVLRKMFGCKAIPKEILEKAKTIPETFSTEEFERGVSSCRIPGAAVHVIGIKEDREYVIGKYLQEAL